MDRTPTYRVQAKTQPLDQTARVVRTRFQGHRRGRGGGGPGRAHGQLICYNCRGEGHYACDCMNLTHPSCLYMEDFPTLITKLRDKGVLQPPLTQNLQMMRSESREEDPNINIVLRSGITKGNDKGKQPEDNTWVCKAPMKELEFGLEHAKETFMEATKSFVDASTLGRKDKPEPEMDPSMLTTFLETCMKLLHGSKVVKGL